MKTPVLVLSLLVAAGAGFAASQLLARAGGPVPDASSKVGTLGPRVVLGNAPVRGRPDAKVTLVEWSDFQCPFCSRADETVRALTKAYPNDLRVVFKHTPLSFHADAPGAARAAVAAQNQGRFWELHDRLFDAARTQVQGAIAEDKLDALAQAAGLDVARFDQDRKSPATAARVDADIAEGRTLGVDSTPTFFVNGKRMVGAQPLEAFKAEIEAQLKRADEELAKGTPRRQLYDALTREGVAPPPAPAPAAPAAPRARTIAVDDRAPSKGSRTAKVTIVEWSDFQCPFCSRVEPTLKQIFDTYGNDVRLVWRNQPLSFHPNALPAAKAAMAAHRQGKFWALHDRMFANQAALSDASYEAWAKEAGLDLARFKADLASPEVDQEIRKDMTEGASVGADGTPAFFVNGKSISGAQPFAAFKAVIDEQLAAADALLQAGTPRAKLYDALVAQNVKAAGSAPAAAPEAPVVVDLGKAPLLGRKDARVTVVVFSDFQCPFCSRVEPTLAELRKQYGDQVRFAWKNEPLAMHPEAMPAAEAAMAAHEQGKFWEFHDRLFANQTKLGPDLYEQTAREVGLDLPRWKSAIASGRPRAAVIADAQQGGALGANGTPTFFINGHRLVGAQPTDSFRQVIDAELGKKLAKN